MPFTLIFGCLKLKRRSRENSFSKSLVYCDVMLDKLGQGFTSVFPSKNKNSES